MSGARRRCAGSGAAEPSAPRRSLDPAAEFAFVADAPEAPGLDVLLRGLSLTCPDEETPRIAGAVLDGLYEFHRRRLLLGREPA